MPGTKVVRCIYADVIPGQLGERGHLHANSRSIHHVASARSSYINVSSAPGKRAQQYASMRVDPSTFAFVYIRSLSLSEHRRTRRPLQSPAELWTLMAS